MNAMAIEAVLPPWVDVAMAVAYVAHRPAAAHGCCGRVRLCVGVRSVDVFQLRSSAAVCAHVAWPLLSCTACVCD